MASLSATAGIGSVTENVSRSAAGFALTLELASSPPAVCPGTPAAWMVISATVPTRPSAACVARYRSGGEAAAAFRLSVAAARFCSLTRTVADDS